MDGCMAGWLVGWMGGWMDGRIDHSRWIDGSMDRYRSNYLVLLKVPKRLVHDRLRQYFALRRTEMDKVRKIEILSLIETSIDPSMDRWSDGSIRRRID